MRDAWGRLDLLVDNAGTFGPSANVSGRLTGSPRTRPRRVVVVLTVCRGEDRHAARTTSPDALIDVSVPFTTVLATGMPYLGRG